MLTKLSTAIAGIALFFVEDPAWSRTVRKSVDQWRVSLPRRALISWHRNSDQISRSTFPRATPIDTGINKSAEVTVRMLFL